MCSFSTYSTLHACTYCHWSSWRYVILIDFFSPPPLWKLKNTRCVWKISMKCALCEKTLERSLIWDVQVFEYIKSFECVATSVFNRQNSLKKCMRVFLKRFKKYYKFLLTCLATIYFSFFPSTAKFT